LFISVAELGTMLRLRAAELEKRLLHDRQTLDRVRGRLRLIEGENAVPITDIEVKHAAAQRVLCLHTAVTAPGGKHVEPLFEQVIERMDAVGADRASPISWHQRHDDRAELVFAGYVAPIEEVPGLETVVLPRLPWRRWCVAAPSMGLTRLTGFSPIGPRRRVWFRPSRPGGGVRSTWKPMTTTTRNGSSKCNSSCQVATIPKP
jgi:hypothetical protein